MTSTHTLPPAPAEPIDATEPLDPTEILDAHLPLVSRVDLDRRVRQLIPCAVQRQLWLLMLDDDDVQMPVMIPIGDLPLTLDATSAESDGIVDLLGSLHHDFGAASFVFVLERTGSRSLDDDDDSRWLAHLLTLGSTKGLRVRAVYLCHDEGVSGYDSADLDELSSERHQAVSASSFDM